jgi:endonuclease YncB( thermonuclease family)
MISVAVMGYFIGVAQDFMAEPTEHSIIGKAEVHDGDTLKIKNTRIRVYGLDAPELKQKCFKNGESVNCGVDSKNELERLIGAREIFCIPLDEDKYQRSDSNCYYRNDNGIKINIGQQMVIEGWALAYKTYSPRYIINEFIARISMKGIWAMQFKKPWDWRKEQKFKHKVY